MKKFVDQHDVIIARDESIWKPLNAEAMQAEFNKRDVLLLKGDFTQRDPEINEWLEKFGRAGVPLYVLFKPGESIKASTLPEIITAGMVMDALDAE